MVEKTKYLEIYLVKPAKAGYLYLKFTKIATNERLIKGYNGGMQGEFALGGSPCIQTRTRTHVIYLAIVYLPRVSFHPATEARNDVL